MAKKLKVLFFYSKLDLPFKNSDASQARDPNMLSRCSDLQVSNADSVVIPMQIRAKCATSTLTERRFFILLERRLYTI